MSDIPVLALAFLAGALLGAFFFGCLWWTVQKGVSSEIAGALVPRQHPVANGCCSGWILFCRTSSLVEARGVPPWICDRARHCGQSAQTVTGGRADRLEMETSLAP